MERTTTELTVISKAKTSLLALAIVLAMVLAAVSPAIAQPTQVTATGVLGEPYTVGEDPTLNYALTDEATGTTYELMSGFVDLGPFVGERVTIVGTRVPGINPLALNVTEIEPAGGQTATATATAAASAQYATAAPTATAAAAGGDTLPATGGGAAAAGLITLGAGALLVGGGLLARRIIR
jgi:LPXTG-motif cell wall-anchored protein